MQPVSHRHRSFLLGAICASVTWIVSLILYSRLSWEAVTTPAIWRDYTSKNMDAAIESRFNNYIDGRNQRVRVGKVAHVKVDLSPSKELVSHLQPLSYAHDLGMVHSSDEQKLRDEGYKNHAFNVLVSHKLDDHRENPDTRHPLCRNKKYRWQLPAASIVICFYNEDLPTLLRSVHSILDRTPEHLIHEILLIDDNSDLDAGKLHSDLQAYAKENLPSKVVVSKTLRREGLIRARVFGAKQASGDVLVFLDSHIEVNCDWLQPLLERIAQNNHTVVTPIIDVINADTFQYSASPMVRGGFNWGLHFKWENIPESQLNTEEDFVKPFRSPTMAGGLFAVNRKYFEKLGTYDTGMNIWGGENLELSFRVWMCGGSLEIIPCSRVGHVFRRRRPYGSPDGEDTMTRNSLRVAHVWMDDYKKYFFQVRPDAQQLTYGDISARVKLRQELGCQSFQWYLKNVYPELSLPQSDSEKARLKHKWQTINNNSKNNKYQPWHLRQRNYINQFQIRQSGTNLCVQTEQDIKTKGAFMSLQNCLRIKSQMWLETDIHELVLAQLLCLDASDYAPRLSKCHEMGGMQEWRHHHERDTPIYNIAAGTCLGAQNSTVGSRVTMELCTKVTGIKWDLIKTN